MPAVQGHTGQATGERNAIVRSFYKCSTLGLIATILSLNFAFGTHSAHCAATPEQTAPMPKDSQPVWSPDGKCIAFVSARAGRNTTAGPKNIWIVNADRTNLKQVTSGGADEYPTWSPDGTRIAYQSGNLLYNVEVANSAVAQLTQGGRAWTAPDWCPKDPYKLICAARLRSIDDNDIFCLNPQTCLTRESGRQTVRQREGYDERPRWSRDGTRIAFIGEVISRLDDSSRWLLMTMKPDGTGMKTHCEVSKASGRPCWMPDGKAVMFEDGRLYDFATGSITLPLGRQVSEPDISPDGTRVAFCETLPGKGTFIYTCKIDGTDIKQITSP